MAAAAPRSTASPTPPPTGSMSFQGMDYSRVADALYNWCRENGEPGDVFSQHQLLAANIIPNKDLRILLEAATLLVQGHLFKIHDLKSTAGVVWELVTQERAANYKDLSADEQLVYGVIDSAGTAGIWTKTIKAKVNAHVKVVEKVYKSLETKGLIKQMKNVKNPNRKMFIVASLQPSEEATGGAWFTDGVLDTELMENVAEFIENIVSKNSWVEVIESEPTTEQINSTSSIGSKRKTPQDGFDTNEKGKAKMSKVDDDGPRSQTPEPKPVKHKPKPIQKRSYVSHPADYPDYPTLATITTELNRLRVSNTFLPQNAIAQLLEVMVYDDRLFKLYRPPKTEEEAAAVLADATGQVTMFKCFKNLEQLREKHKLEMRKESAVPETRKAAQRQQELEDIGSGGMTEVPCLRCPVFHLCGKGGTVNVETCGYFDDWFQKMDDADKEGEIQDGALIL